MNARASRTGNEGGVFMIGMALIVLGAAAAPTPCDSLTNLKLDKALVTSAELVP